MVVVGIAVVVVPADVLPAAGELDALRRTGAAMTTVVRSFRAA
jgi:hypothetical protein